MQHDILVRLQGDASDPSDTKDASALDLTPVGVVDHPEPKKHVKKPSTDSNGPLDAPKYKRPTTASDQTAPLDMDDDEETKPKKRRKRTRTPKPPVCEKKDEEDEDANIEDEMDCPPPKRKRSRAKIPTVAPDKTSQSGRMSSSQRRQPGYAMIKAEDDRLRGALESLIRKRGQREAVSGGRAPTSTCGVLTNNLIDFYETVVDSFAHKFGRYID